MKVRTFMSTALSLGQREGRERVFKYLVVDFMVDMEDKRKIFYIWICWDLSKIWNIPSTVICNNRLTCVQGSTGLVYVSDDRACVVTTVWSPFGLWPKPQDLVHNPLATRPFPPAPPGFVTVAIYWTDEFTSLNVQLAQKVQQSTDVHNETVGGKTKYKFTYKWGLTSARHLRQRKPQTYPGWDLVCRHNLAR